MCVQLSSVAISSLRPVVEVLRAWPRALDVAPGELFVAVALLSALEKAPAAVAARVAAAKVLMMSQEGDQSVHQHLVSMLSGHDGTPRRVVGLTPAAVTHRKSHSFLLIRVRLLLPRCWVESLGVRDLLVVALVAFSLASGVRQSQLLEDRSVSGAIVRALVSNAQVRRM